MTTYHYRDKLTRRELLPALGAGAAVGAAVAYLVQIVLRKRTIRSGAGETPPPEARPVFRSGVGSG
jgi:hypothetical protein